MKPSDRAESGLFERSYQSGKSYRENSTHIERKTANGLIVRNTSRLQPVASSRVKSFCVPRHGDLPVQMSGIPYLSPEYAGNK